MIEHEQPDSRGEPEPRRRQRKHRSSGFVFYQPGSRNAYIQYEDNHGRRKRESSNSPLESVALRLLRKRQGELDRQGKVVGPQIEKTTYLDGEKALLRHFDNKGKYVERQARKSMEGRLAHLRRHFRHTLAMEIGYGEVEEYVAKRLRQGAAKSTVRTEVGLLHLALVRLVAGRKLVQVPTFPRVEKSPPREGSAKPEEIVRLIDHLPGYLQPLVKVGYVTGWRGKHLREMTWAENVLPGSVLFLPKVEGNKKRMKDVRFDFSGTPWLMELIERQRQERWRVERERGIQVEHVFPNPEGGEITDNAYKLAWQRARKRAGLPTLKRHDMRRSATQNNRKLAIDKTVRMALVGHKSEAVHDAYDGADQAELTNASKAIGDYLAPTLGQAGGPANGPTEGPTLTDPRTGPTATR